MNIRTPIEDLGFSTPVKNSCLNRSPLKKSDFTPEEILHLYLTLKNSIIHGHLTIPPKEFHGYFEHNP